MLNIYCVISFIAGFWLSYGFLHRFAIRVCCRAHFNEQVVPWEECRFDSPSGCRGRANHYGYCNLHYKGRG